MSTIDWNQVFVLGCIATITGAPFIFRAWIHRFPVRTVESIDQVCSRLSLLIFATLFSGAFVFGFQSRNTGKVLLIAAILSFSILYQIRYRYLVSSNREKSKAPKLTLEKPKNAELKKLGVLAVVAAAVMGLRFFPLAFPLLFVISYYFQGYFTRLRYPTTPMAPSQLRTAFLEIFTKAGAKVDEIYLIDETAGLSSNAFLGGKSLFITLDVFSKLNELELMAVTCHEASHLELRHRLKRAAVTVGVLMLVFFWILFPAMLANQNQAKTLFFVAPVLFVAQNWLIGKYVRRQEFEADLGAVSLGASSDALVSALHKLSPNSKSKVPLSTRLIFANFHPTTEEREFAIRNGSVPKSAYFQYKKYAAAYSLLVVGYTFHSAQQMELAAKTKGARAPAAVSPVSLPSETSVTTATISATNSATSAAVVDENSRSFHAVTEPTFPHANWEKLAHSENVESDRKDQ